MPRLNALTATLQLSYDNGQRLEQVTEATGGSAPTADVELNVKADIRRDEILIALEHFKHRVATSKSF